MLQQFIKDNLKNIYGWKTPRKIVVFSVDDYGNVRVDSPAARQRMNAAGLKVLTRFDAYDALETTADLQLLYETLDAVKDQHGNPAVFTAFTLPCNINFEAMQENGYREYVSELLPETFSKLRGYENTWATWQEGIRKKFIHPEFHGREHLNLKVFEEKLEQGDPEVLTALANRSYTSISGTGYSTIAYTAAFEFSKLEENQRFAEVIRDGLQAFEQIFGTRAVVFNPPRGNCHPQIYPYLQKGGIQYIDAPLAKKMHLGNGQYKRSYNYTGKQIADGQTALVRNVVFEPTNDRGIDWVTYALRQVEIAFRWNRPAIISSHRVNFCGHMDPENRKVGLTALRRLLEQITRHWPEVEFLSASELGRLVTQKR